MSVAVRADELRHGDCIDLEPLLRDHAPVPEAGYARVESVHEGKHSITVNVMVRLNLPVWEQVRVHDKEED